MAEVVLEFLIRIGRHSQGPNMKDFGIKESLGVGFDESDQGSNEELGFTAGRMDKNPIPPMDMAEDFFLGGELLRKNIFPFFTDFMRDCQDSFTALAAARFSRALFVTP